ncbi:MAG: hypothetical protein ACYS5V_06110 [Planctomycetota bacterium]|jgi:hypothetical protein
MTRARNKGFSIVVALAMLVLAGAALVVLAHASGAMAMETQTALCRARADNLIASGRAWAQLRADRPAKDRQLSTDALAVPGGELTVSLSPAGDKVTLRIQAACRRGRWPFRRTVTEVLPAPEEGPAAAP